MAVRLHTSPRAACPWGIRVALAWCGASAGCPRCLSKPHGAGEAPLGTARLPGVPRQHSPASGPLSPGKSRVQAFEGATTPPGLQGPHLSFKHWRCSHRAVGAGRWVWADRGEGDGSQAHPEMGSQGTSGG